jgi:hypothetical protein
MNSSPNPTETSTPTASSASSANTTKADDHRRLIEAVALSLATNSFNSAAVRSHAAKRRKDLLNDADSIEWKEAQRRINSRLLEDDYKRLAKYAAPKSMHLDEPTLINILRSAEEWPFRLLTEAKRLAGD